MTRFFMDSLSILSEYEERYHDVLQDNPIEILREINVTTEEVDEISKHIKILWDESLSNTLKLKYRVTISLFLVWCTVYEYKEGNMWSNIFNKLEISLTGNSMRFFGDIFLSVLEDYDLTKCSEGQGKKYLSPILMHGYISNHYSNDLFNYLNKIYSVVLEGDTSTEAIENIWDDIFSDNTIEVKTDLEKRKEDLENELKGIIINEELRNINKDDVRLLEIEVDELENQIIFNQDEIISIEENQKVHKDIDKEINTIDNSLDKLFTGNTHIDISSAEIKEIYDLIENINKAILDKKNIRNKNMEKLTKENKKLTNILSIKKESLMNIQSKIATLGQGNISDGWLEIEAYQNINDELRNIGIQIEKNERIENISIDENTTLNQVLTSSLRNLRSAHSDHFKQVIVEIIQMMGLYYIEGELDATHPIYDALIEWFNRTPKSQDPTPINLVQTGNSKPTSRKNLVLQRMKKPYIKFDVNNLLISTVIPEQVFSYNKEISGGPSYTLINNINEEIQLDIDYFYNNGDLYIKEIELPIRSSNNIQVYFSWHNLKELHYISLDEVMVYDQLGNIMDNKKLQNGYYYIICHNSWTIDSDIVISNQIINIEEYELYEVYLNETKTTLHSNDNRTFEIIATDYSKLYLDKYNPIEGVTVEGIDVVAGTMPEVIINTVSKDLSNAKLSVLMNGGLLITKSLKNVIEENKKKRNEPQLRLNINTLLGMKGFFTANKFKFLLTNEKNETLFQEEFYHLPRTKISYISEGLKVKIGRGMRFKATNYHQQGVEYTIPLRNRNGETFSIYYDRYGWLDFKVEVPYVSVNLVDKYGIKHNKDNVLYGSKRDYIKDLYADFKSNSKRLKSILLFDGDHRLETEINLKDGKANVSLNPYFDVLNSEKDEQLFFKAQDPYIKTEEELLLNIYNKWTVDNIIVQQKEEDDEYILGIEYNENFHLEETKYIEVTNDNQKIIRKELKDQIYLYIKKKDLISNNIVIEFSYSDEYDTVFGKEIETIVAGKTEVKLKSKLSEIERILKHGIIIKSFKYQGNSYSFKETIDIELINKAGSRNFKGEEIYTTQYPNNQLEDVYFYIDIENKTIPFMIDEDYDGAQYDPKTGRVFWEHSNDREIMGPIENIKYIIKEDNR